MKENPLGPNPCPYTIITIEDCGMFEDETSGRRTPIYRFTFDWGSQHWKDHYRELMYVPNIYYYTLDVWQSIINIANNTDPLNHALLYVSEEGEHVPVIAKMLLEYGIEAIKFDLRYWRDLK